MDYLLAFFSALVGGLVVYGFQTERDRKMLKEHEKQIRFAVAAAMNARIRLPEPWAELSDDFEDGPTIN